MNLRGDKKGSEKYYIIISLILGILILALVLWFIFHEYFTEDVLDMESCRQSIVLRGTIPDVKKASFTLASFKDAFPLKCKTEVVTIDYQDLLKAEKEVADMMVQCWYLYGNGNLNIFPSDVYGLSSMCSVCARIQIDDSAKDFYVRNYVDKKSGKTVDNRIDIEKALSRNYDKKSYKDYLNEVGNFPAFNPAYGREFNYAGQSFFVDASDSYKVLFRNPQKKTAEKTVALSRVDLPKYFDPNKNLLIAYGTLLSSDSSGIGGYIPYLFYLHDDRQDNFDLRFVDGFLWHNLAFCKQLEGIPA
tara:strand:- start:37 stop:945 length:909 start_codon:yes stop_codon:yes gene_type:complete